MFIRPGARDSQLPPQHPQVHRATLRAPDGSLLPVAVKVCVPYVCVSQGVEINHFSVNQSLRVWGGMLVCVSV